MTELWVKHEYEDGSIAWQCECPSCDRGLSLAPARFCFRCGGTGFLVKWQIEEPRLETV